MICRFLANLIWWAGLFKCNNIFVPKKCPIICFAPDKKIIFCTFRIRGTLVFLRPKEREREGERELERERAQKRERKIKINIKIRINIKMKIMRKIKMKIKIKIKININININIKTKWKIKRKSKREKNSAGDFISKPHGPKWKICELYRKEQYSM